MRAVKYPPDILDPKDEPCDPDINGDGVVGVNDLLMIIASWGPCDGCDADVNGDSTVNVDDLLLVIGGWGACP